MRCGLDAISGFRKSTTGPATELARDPAHCFSFFFVMVRQVPKSEFEGTWAEGADRVGQAA
jgi:hypothetical protein